MPLELFVNGKFCAQQTTGVQRYAGGLLVALDAYLASAPGATRFTLLVPDGASTPPLRAVAVRRVPWRGPGGLHAWEQVALPRAARSGRLLNLAGSAPAWGVRRQLCVMHDAAPFDQRRAHTRVFGHWYRWLFRHLALRPDTSLVTVSEFSRACLASALQVPAGRFTVVPGAAGHLDDVVADPAVLESAGLGRQSFVLAVGSRNPSKNLATLVDAWRLLDRADLRLVLVGGGNSRVFCDAPPVPAGAGVTDLGPVGDASLKALYGNALALVFPSVYEGFGLPPLEAMTCGCPVAASTAEAVREVCGDAALYFDPSAPQAIADALRRLADNAALRDDLRERGRRRAARFSWDDSARAMLNVLAAAP
jgi:glycosyltransferase involved in cell wall biosynthesis